jgi:uncharacterized membrane protein YdbT with pleckstrin-like domain
MASGSDKKRKGPSVVRGHWIVLVKGFLYLLVGIGISIFGTENFERFPGSIQEVIDNPGLVFSWAFASKIFGTACIIYGGIDAIYKQIWLITSKVTIKRDGIEWQTGILNQVSEPISFSRIEGAPCYRSLLGRILDYGTLRIYGVGSYTITIPHLKRAIALSEFIEKHKELHKTGNRQKDRDAEKEGRGEAAD